MKKRLKWGFLSFLVPILIILVALLHRRATLHSFFVSDLGEQYYQLFIWFKDILSGKESLIYSFSKGLGGDMLQTYYYYLSSPFNFLLTFVSKEHIDLFMFILILTKIGLCGLSIFIYLVNKKSNLKLYQIFILSISYALMSYNLTYFFNIMWLDVVIISPIVFLGIDKLFEKNNWWIYTIFLTCTIIFNYYIAYMLCIFCVVYVIYKIIVLKNYKDIKKILLKFILLSLLSALLASFVLIPIALGVSDIFRMEYNSSESIIKKLMKLIYNMSIRTQYKRYDYYSPYVHSTFYVSILVISILLNIKKARPSFIYIALVFLFLFLINDDIMYFFAKPSCFMYRYNFLFVLFLIVYISDFYEQKLISNRKMILIFTIYLSINLLTTYFLKRKFNLYLIFVNSYLLFSTFFINNKCQKRKSKLFPLAMIFLVIMELYISCNATLRLLSKSQTLEFEKKMSRKAKISDIEDDYYRINSKLKFADSKTTSAFFLSTNRKDVLSFFERNGSGISSVWYEFYNNTFLVNVLGYKYDEICDIDQNCTIKKLKNSTSIGYMIKKNEKENQKTKNVFECNNNFARFLNDTTKKIYVKHKYKKIDEYTYEIESNQKQVYTNIKYNVYDFVDIYLNNKKIIKEYSNEDNILKLNLKKGKNILKIKSNFDLKSKITVYAIQTKELKKLVKSLNEETFNVTYIKKNKLKGNIDVSGKKKKLLITIPYQKGWKIKVDGKKVNYYKMYDIFIGIDLKKGKHSIEMQYYDHNIVIGEVVSILTLIGIVCYFFVKKCIIDRKRMKN